MRGDPLQLRGNPLPHPTALGGARAPGCRVWYAGRRPRRQLPPLRRGLLRDGPARRRLHPAQLPGQAPRARAHAEGRAGASSPRRRALPRDGAVPRARPRRARDRHRHRRAERRPSRLRGADRDRRGARDGSGGRGRRDDDPHVHERHDGPPQGRHAHVPRLHGLRDRQRGARRRHAAWRGAALRAALPHRRHDQHDDDALDRASPGPHAAVRAARLARSGRERAHHARLPRANDAEAAARRAGPRAPRPLEPGDSLVRWRIHAVSRHPPRHRALPDQRRVRERVRADGDHLDAHHPRTGGPPVGRYRRGDRAADQAPHLDRPPASRRRGADRRRGRRHARLGGGGRDLRPHAARHEGIRGRYRVAAPRRLAPDA